MDLRIIRVCIVVYHTKLQDWHVRIYVSYCGTSTRILCLNKLELRVVLCSLDFLTIDYVSMHHSYPS